MEADSKDTTERRFLRDLLAGADGTAGGRLAAWLLPESRVEPAHCEIRTRAPDADVRADCPLPLVVYLRDQYGDLVRSLPVTVDIHAQPITSSSAAHRKNRHLSYQPRQNYGGRVPPPSDVHYKPTIKDAMCFHAITMMKPYQSHSFEEIRMACPNSSGIAHRPPEKLLVHLLLDGTYSSTWTPTVPGMYVLQCTIDEQPVSQDLVIEVKESISTSVGLRSPSGPGPSKISGSSRAGSESQTSPSRPCKLRRFSVLQSAGLRIRAHPSLQSEQIGIVQVHTTIAFTDEVQNGDGIWLRLSYDCARTFCNIKSAEAWCLQYHQQLAKTLLVSIEPPSNAKIMDNENPWLYDDRRTIYGLPYPEYSGDSNAPESPEPEPEELPPNAEPQIEDSDSDSKKGFDFTVKDLDQPNPNNDFRFTADDNASPFVFGDDEDDLIRDDMLSMINPSSPKEDIDSENIPKSFKFGNGNGSSPPEFREWRHKYGSSSRDSSLSDSHSSSFERFMKNRITNDFSHASMQQQDPPKLTQTGTQTSPEAEVERSFKGKFSIGSSPKSDPASPRHRNYSSPDRKIPTSKLSVSPNESSNPLPSTSATPISYPPTPKPQKFAVGFAEAESIRAVFAALLWHEGIVHDAMACASFLKFHPSLPKEGTMVVTRNTNQKTAVTQHRHSVEVSNAGTYLNIQASTLESLTRSGLNASASRARAKRDATSIREEEAGPSTSSFIPKQTEQKDKTDAEPPNVVCVLPQALRALVALWDAMCVAQGVIIPSADRNCTEKKDKKLQDTMKDKDLKKGTRKKKEWKPNAMSPYTIFCELCTGSTISPPMAGHMRRVHPGCGIPCIRGYDRNGIYGVAQLSMPQVGSSVANGSTCGHVTQGYNLWYILCEVCRDKSIRTSRQNKSGLSSLKAMPGLYADENNEKMDMQAPLEISRLHMTAKENALFLLELVPALNSSNVPKAAEKTQTYESQASDSPTTTSTWHPVPPFQCMDTLGVQVKDNDDTYNFGVRDFAHKDYGGTQQFKREPTQRDSDYDESSNEGSSFENPEAGASSAMFNRFHRSVSMGQGSSQPFPQDETTAEIRKNQGEDVSGSSLLGQPSPALENLVFSCDGPTSGVSVLSTPHVDVNSLSNRPVMTFISGNRDLVALRNHMLDSIKMSTVRQYALEAMNWFMHSVTQPICLHDLMWWFCAALEQFNMLGISADNTDRFDNNNSRGNMPRHPYSSSSYGSSGGIRFALHAFLRSVGKLMQVLPNSSPALLQAVRCWALRYSPTDHTFLHRSQVFSVISKILSHSEDDTSEEGAVGFTPSEGISTSMNEKNYENYVWSCPDITSLCEVSVSSRQGMISSLTDGSTETFWESGDEDRNKSKWVQVAFHANSDERPHMICLHIDNTRDPSEFKVSDCEVTEEVQPGRPPLRWSDKIKNHNGKIEENKTLMVTFLMGGSSSDLYNIQNIEVDTKTGSWACFTLPRDSNPPVRIRCELRGPDQASRVRQLKVFGAPVPKYVNHNMPNVLPGNFLGAGMQKPVTTILRQYIELETLRVFRLITSQVFGKLLEGEPYNEVMLGTESPGGGKIGQGSDDTNLREHVVGILFSRSKLTSLQKQVMTHIVSAIGSEAKRAREEWENNLNLEEMSSGKATPTDNSTSESDGIKQQDNYCFEMLSMVLALSGSSVGRAHLARRPELLSDLLSLLHTGSARVQRQVIALLRRMVCELSPQKMDAALNIGIQSQTHRTTLIDNLVTYLSKAISVQVKVKGVISNNAAGPSTSSGNRTSSMYGPGRPSGGATIMANNVFLTPPGYWFMKGITTRKHAQLVIDLLSEMADGKVMQAWSTETQNALAKLVARLITVPEPNRSPQQSLANPQLWLALGALCVLEENHIDRLTSCGWMDILNQSEGGKKNSDTKQPRDKESRPFCINHDDSETVAIIECQNCGLLCQECDRFLHLSRNTRHHHRQICKEEESSIRIDVHEGCGRAKLFWLLLLVDRRALKALAEFRGSSDTGQDLNPDAASTSCWTPGSAGTCRFCGARSNTGLLAIGNVCADHDCQEYSRSACPRILQCGHLCGGVRGERSCLPCLNGCSVPGVPRLRQDADDMCMICFTDPLAAAPAIQLKCRHLFHLHCCKKVLANKWNGPRITFSFSQCPICKENMSHNTLEDLVAPIRKLQEEVMRKALMRLEYEGLKNAAVIATRYRNDPASYAMEKYAYYVCFKCHKAYYGGEARCEIELVEGAGAGWGSAYDPSELVCGACSDIAGARTCPKHGADFLEYKCRYCCSVAVFFCFGTSHFCNACHDDFQRVTNVPQHQLPVCPAGPKAKQLEGSSDDCPLHVKHPCTGEEFALGCGVCRNAHTF